MNAPTQLSLRAASDLLNVPYARLCWYAYAYPAPASVGKDDKDELLYNRDELESWWQAIQRRRAAGSRQ